MHYYTGVGSRETPPEVISVMEDAAFRLARLGFTLRSGKAGGADAAFQIGMQKFYETLDNGKEKEYLTRLAEIYIPWEGFGQDREDLWDFWDMSPAYMDFLFPDQSRIREALVEEIHPNYEALKRKRGALALHCRNVHQVLGVNLHEPRPSAFCLYYAQEDKKGNPKGGTATAVNLAKKYGVRTLNLNTPERLSLLEQFLTNLERKRGVQV
uniref:DprA-like DNA recombination-mediator protein n=1 Tax=Salmonella phage vB_SEnST11_KE23 TaxID=3161174 RepID=A0AAU8GFN3_9CAUD